MILIATDKFKGTFNAKQIVQIIADAIKQTDCNSELKLLPLADGGEGTAEILAIKYKAKPVNVTVEDPLGRNIETNFFYSKKKKIAIIESAKASGLELLSEHERTPLDTSSFGTGQLIVSAIEKGAKKIIISLGGSAVNDAAAGAAYALGYRFYDTNNKNLKPKGENIGSIWRISKSNLKFDLDKIKFIVLTDVNNPLCGTEGATQVYARQKGADKEIIKVLETGMCSFSVLLEVYRTGVSTIPGAGAAGGMGAGLAAFLNAKLKTGTDFIFKAVKFKKYLKKANLVITGEGESDRMSFKGKLPGAVVEKAAKYNIPTAIICGINSLENFKLPPNVRIFPLFKNRPDKETAVKETQNRILLVVKEILNNKYL